MAKSYIVMLLMRVIVPATLLLSIALRPFGLSLVYLLLFLLSPLPQMPDAKTIKGFRGRYLLLIVSLSVGLLLVHGVWHSVLAGFGPYGSLLDDYPVMEKIGHNLGLVSYRNIDPLMAVHFLAPELVMVGSSIIIYNIVNKVTTSTGTQTDSKSSTKHQRWPLLTTAGKYLCLFLIMFSGIMRPSITSGIYFLVFMGAATAWSLGRPLERGFAVVGRCLMAIMAVHVMTLLVYQCTWLEELYEPHKNFSRYFGLTQMVILNQTTPDTFEYMVSVDNRWGTLASPLVILLTYYVLAVETRELFKPKPKRRSHMPGLEGGKLNGSLVRGVSFHRGSRNSKEKWKSATKKVRVAYSYINSKALRGDADETTPMIRSVSPSKRWSSVRGGPSRGLRQDSTGSVVVGEDESVMSDPTLLDDIMAAVVGFFRVIVRSSYIATTIIMMAWSIMFHSWLTFVFLMWANIVWLCPNQRSVMLKTSPVLVLYAMLLLVAQYIYGMDLTEAELPSNTTAVNLSQVGLGRVVGEPCVVLMIKSLFTCMFWVTLRQRVQEINERRRAAAAGDIAAPLQLTVSTAASVVEAQREEEEKSRLLVALGAWLRAACARYWIYVVVIMLLVIGITGERMTIFRIIYMLLFLAFILMFQISWYWWRRFMYVFWITVIIYSMINLILIYIYQFDNFSKTIETYLLINERLQHDLGLEPYHPADLFVKLLTPTLFLIITIMQVHYFHHDFMVLSEQKTGSQAPKDIDSSRPSQGASTLRDDIGALSEDERLRNQSEADERSVTDISVAGAMRRSLRRKASRSRSRSRSRSVAATVTEPRSQSFRGWAQQQARLARGLAIDAFEKLFMLLELHLLKIIMVALMLLCVSDVCAMHVPIMIIISPGLLLHQRQQRLCVLLISVLISMYIMAKMVYQIDYIKHSLFDVNCTTSDFNSTVTYNNAQWMGFVKATSRRPLAVLVKGYIGVLAVITFYSLVCYRQQRKRQLGQLPSDNQKIFPNVTRTHADKDLSHCIMFLFNYGFYKFGVEITLICLMGVIGSRMDVYAVVYAVWLLLLASMRRETLRRIWGGFTAFVTFIVPVQYMIAVGFLPMYCIYYPWTGSSEQLKHLRTWLFLPYYSEEPPHALKLVFDYFLLVFATRQLRAFRVEWAAGRARSYSGGCNEENAGSDWETPKFVNPVPDFLGTVGSWLDILKRVIFLCMLWLTLAIMFMTGTNRVNLFSMGYLIGSFIFLWQGTDFYLLPKESILQWWSWLLLYNVSVVAVKTLLQIPGCIFTDIMQEHACWLVQLLGIGCVDKFAGGNIARFLKMDYSLQNSTCSVPQEDIGLAWDGVCFAFLLLQRRLFHSYYFYRVIDESKAITVLASRGAELIEELRQKQMQVQENQEGKILEKIKAKMERIKANQKKMQGALSSKEPRHHDCGDGSEHQPARNRRRAYSKRHEAVRSGDYYMFDDFDDTDIAVKAPGEEDSDEDLSKEMGIVKLVSTVIKTDLKSAVSMRRLRRASAPVFPAPRPHSRASTAGPNTYPQEDTGVTREVEPGPSREREGEREGPPSDKGDRDHDRTSEIEDYAPPPEKETWFDKLKGILETVWMFMESILVSVTRHVMKYSRDYRYVSNTLSVEKKLIKERPGFGIGLREGSQMRWEPLPGALYQFRKLSDISVPEIRILAPSMERGLDASPPPPPARRGADLAPSDDDTSEHESAFSLQTTESKDVSMLEDQDDSLLRRGNNPFLKLCVALWYAVLAHTDIVCYLMVFVNQIQSATILSIPLPLMVFLWGTLTVPRPSKTFWVTMIAYTEVIVLIKSMFQFEILPWNQKAIPANMPFTAPRIIGIERKYHYALYDLMLLLIIFFHRFMLKSLGLWKESVPEVELRDDKEYPVTPEDRKMLVEGDGEEVGHKYVKLHDVDGPTDKVEESGQLVSQEMAFGDAEPGPSKQSDDEHYKVNDDEEPIIAVTTNLETTYEEYYKVIFLSVKRYLRPTRTFFMRIIKAGSRVTADIYAYMFLCDFFNFLVVIFGFAAFGTHQGDGGVQTYLEDNKVPIPFLAMLILQFALIIIDRALYLRKFMLGKILFQYALIIGVHVWMFFVLPFITERTFNTLLAPPMWYMVKCIYLLLSAYQIRCGYPRRIIGNFLCKSYNFVNMVLFRLFIAVPFVFELRTLMDWIWTDTSMTLMDWLKMEDIFASVFLLKCSRYVEDEFPQARGEKKSSTSKYLLGGGVLALIITIIWFPLVFFAFGDSVGQPNPPTDVTVKIRIGPFLPVYQMSAQSHNIDQFNEQDYAQLSNLYARDRTVQTFLSAYMYNDVAVVSINPNSTMKWVISPPELERLEKEAESNATLSVKFTYVITHLTNAQNNPPVIEDNREVDLPAFVETARNKERDKLYRMLVNKATDDDWIDVKTLFPKFVKVFNKGTVRPVYQLMPETPDSLDPNERLYRDVQLRLERQNATMYWRVREKCASQETINSIPLNDCNMLVMYTFNDKLFPETLNFISGSGIIGLYTTFVLLASRVIRGFFSGIYNKIMFDDLPNVDRVLQLCLDIYLVREAVELTLEEDLFAKLVFLYRSPETMIKWTRPKEDEDDQRELQLERELDEPLPPPALRRSPRPDRD